MMALAREHYTLPEPILSPGTKSFLERFSLGRWGLRVGRAIRPIVRNLRDPIQHKVWARQLILPLRNVALLNRPVTVSFGEFPVRLIPRGSTAGDLWAGLRTEQPEESFALNILEPGMIVFDVGASAGLFSIGAAKRIGGKGIFAFEPCSSTAELLKRNLRLNELTDVHVEPIALGDSVGEGVLQLNARGKDALNALANSTHVNCQVAGQEKVRISTVDVFMKERGIPRVDVLIADVRGAERMVFRGAQHLLERPDAPLILYEGCADLTRGFGYHPVEILWFLESCGYTLFSRDRETQEISELNPDYRYDSAVIAAKPEHPAYAKLQASAK